MCVVSAATRSPLWTGGGRGREHRDIVFTWFVAVSAFLRRCASSQMSRSQQVSAFA